jgi:hypothetical protein
VIYGTIGATIVLSILALSLLRIMSVDRFEVQHLKVVEDAQGMEQSQIAGEPLAAVRRSSQFIRFVIGEIRAKLGVPKYNIANETIVRRMARSIVLEERKDIRGSHLEWLVERITDSVFIPNERQILRSRLMNDDIMPGYFGRLMWKLYDWLHGLKTINPAERMERYCRPTK